MMKIMKDKCEKKTQKTDRKKKQRHKITRGDRTYSERGGLNDFVVHLS